MYIINYNSLTFRRRESLAVQNTQKHVFCLLSLDEIWSLNHFDAFLPAQCQAILWYVEDSPEYVCRKLEYRCCECFIHDYNTPLPAYTFTPGARGRPSFRQASLVQGSRHWAPHLDPLVWLTR